MNEYIFYTMEGDTIAPYEDVEIENCQVLGRIQAKNIEQAKQLLLKENQWIEDAGFDTSGIIVKQIFTDKQKADIKAIVDYLWEEKHKHFQELHYPKTHIYRIIKRLRSSYE